MSIIKDINLAPSGEMKINWVERNMPVLRGIGRRFSEEKPFKGLKVALSVHLELRTFRAAQRDSSLRLKAALPFRRA